MLDLWDLLKDIDYAAKLKPLLDSLDGNNQGFVALLVIFFVYLGSKMVSGQPGLRALGLRLAAVTVLLFGGYAWFETRETPNRDYLSIGLRCFNASGLVLALTWIVLPVVSFFYAHLRLALAAFLGYCFYGIVLEGNYDPNVFPLIASKALVAVGLTLVVAWILHPIWDWIKAMLPEPAPKPAPVPAAPSVAPPAIAVVSPTAPVLAPVSPPTFPLRPEPVTWQPRPGDYPVVPRQEPLTATVGPANLELQRRRDKIRLKLEMAYVLAMPAITSRLPRPVFDDFMHRYLGDHLPPEDVEEHGRQLELILHEYQQQAQATTESRSLLFVQEHQQAQAAAEPRSVEDLFRRFLDEQQRRQPFAALEHPVNHRQPTDLHANHLETPGP